MQMQLLKRNLTMRRFKICRPLHLGVFPVLFAVCVMLTFIITYMIAVAEGHVFPYFPTISDTGGLKPESNIFGFLLSICSFLGFIVVLIRYVQYKHISENNEDSGHSRVIFFNKLALVFGIVACIGSNIVASFQDRGISVEEHTAGALGVFGGGVVYCCLQTYLSYIMLKCGMNSKYLCRLRMLLSFISGACLIGFFVLFYAATKELKPKHPYNMWDPSDPGYVYHVISSACEWICAIFLLLFFMSFSGEFSKVKLGLVVRRNDLNILPFQISTDDHDDQAFVYA